MVTRDDKLESLVKDKLEWLVIEKAESLVKGKMCGSVSGNGNIDGRWSIVTCWISKEVDGAQGLVDV